MYKGTLEKPNWEDFNRTPIQSREANVRGGADAGYSPSHREEGKDYIAPAGTGVYCCEKNYKFYQWGHGGYRVKNYNNSNLGKWEHPRNIHMQHYDGDEDGTYVPQHHSPIEPRSKGMNLSQAVFLLDDSVRAIETVYDDNPGSRKYTYKSLDQNIKVDDFVVIPSDSRHKMAVVKVTAVDVEIDFTRTDIEYKWIMAVINLEDHEQVLALEQVAFDHIKAAERKKAKDALRESLDAFQSEALGKVKSLEDLSKK